MEVPIVALESMQAAHLDGLPGKAAILPDHGLFEERVDYSHHPKDGGLARGLCSRQQPAP